MCVKLTPNQKMSPKHTHNATSIYPFWMQMIRNSSDWGGEGGGTMTYFACTECSRTFSAWLPTCKQADDPSPKVTLGLETGKRPTLDSDDFVSINTQDQRFSVSKYF